MNKHTQLLAKTLFSENLSASEIARRTGLSQPTVSRALQHEPVIRIGQGRSGLYAWVDTVEGHPLHVIDEAGQVNLLATLYRQPNNRVLLLLQAGGYQTYDDVPWFLNSVLPAGFLGRLHGESLSNRLPVNKNPALWSANEVFLYLLNEAYDLSGNLLIGKVSAQRYLTHREQLQPVTPADYDAIAQQINQIGFAGSSVAGEQPKFLAYIETEEPYYAIVKYSAPLSLDSPGAQRYRDLLVAEHLALQCLHEHGIASSASRLLEGERLYLEVKRFDRVGAHGRKGIVSLRDVEAEFIGESTHWHEAADRLLRLNMIDEPTHRTIHLLYAFGVLIGNTDMHFGNLSFYFEGLELRGLAPVYDMLPMLYMPVRDEVVEREFKVPPLLGIAEDVLREAGLLAREFWNRVGGDERVSVGFQEIGRGNSDILGAENYTRRLLARWYR